MSRLAPDTLGLSQSAPSPPTTIGQDVKCVLKIIQEAAAKNLSFGSEGARLGTVTSPYDPSTISHARPVLAAMREILSSEQRHSDIMCAISLGDGSTIGTLIRSYREDMVRYEIPLTSLEERYPPVRNQTHRPHAYETDVSPSSTKIHRMRTVYSIRGVLLSDNITPVAIIYNRTPGKWNFVMGEEIYDDITILPESIIAVGKSTGGELLDEWGRG